MAIRFPSLAEVGDKVSTAFRRFPLACLTAIFCTVVAIVLIEHEHDNAFMEQWGRLALAASLGLPLFVALSVFSEKNGHAPGLRWGLQAAGLVAIGLAWSVIDPSDNHREVHSIVWYVGLSFLFHLMVSFAAYLKKDGLVLDFWEFNKQLFLNFLAGGVYSAVIFGGLAVALGATNELFDLHLSGKVWARLWVLVVGLFQTGYFLSNFPRDYEFDHSEVRYETVVRNLVKWVLIPIAALYFLILYAYSAKIMLSWHLPTGWVSWLVVGFSVAGIFTWLMNFMLPRIDGAAILSFFKKWFWPVVAPMVVLLFVAVGRRIRDYGLTEDRYLIAHLGAWLLLMAAYFIFSKKDDIRAIPISLAVFTIVYLMPGLGGIDAGTRSQTRILQGLLEKNGILKNGSAIIGAKEYGGEDGNRMRSLIDYLGQRDALGPVAAWLGKTPADFKKENSRYSTSSAVADALGIGHGSPSGDGAEARTKSYYRHRESPLTAMPVAGFDSLHQVDFTRSGLPQDGRVFVEEGGRALVFDGKKTDIGPLIDSLWSKEEYGVDPVDDMAPLELGGTSSAGRMLFNQLTLKKEEGNLRLESGMGWLLVKKK